MKKITLATLFLSSISFFANSQNSNRLKNEFLIVENNDNTLQFKSSFLSKTITASDVSSEIGVFSELNIEGYGSSSFVGEPKLPVLKQLIEVPLDAEFDIQFTYSNTKEYSLPELGINHPIVAAQYPVSKSADRSKIPFEYKKEVYAKNTYIDRPLVEVIPVGIMRGVRLARLEVSPVQYNPTSDLIKVYENLEVKISYKNANVSQTRDLKAKTYSPYFEASYNMLANYSANTSRPNFTRYPVKYVIVSDPMFKTALQPFVKWKTKKGFTVIEAYTDNASVGKTTTSIKDYLKKLYTAGTATDPAPSFVLLVGDVAQVPTFTGIENKNHSTDLYYCEYTNDKLPEVYYGRFSATTLDQLQPQIDKTLEYEQYLMPDPSFLNKSVLISGVDKSFGDVHLNGQINYGSATYYNATNNIDPKIYLYPASGSNASKIIQDVSTGVAFANYTAHGWSGGWAEPAFSNTNVASLKNKGKYPLMVGNCCQSNTFVEPSCFGETLLRAKDKGAIGYIGGSNNTFFDEDFYFGVGYRSSITKNPTYSATQLGMYDKAFHTHSEKVTEWYVTQAQMLNAGNLAVEQSGASLKKYYWEIYHLMGDPSLMPYLFVPSKLAVTYTSPIPASANTVSIQTESYAYVAVSFNGVLCGVALADANGLASITLKQALNNGDIADVVVTKQNRQPFSGKLNIGAGTGITNLISNNTLTVYPSPNNGIFTISGIEKNNHIAIYDMLGKLAHEFTSNTSSVMLDMKEYNKGVYLIKVTNNENNLVSTVRMVID